MAVEEGHGKDIALIVGGAASIKQCPFEVVIRSLYQCEVIPFDQSCEFGTKWLQEISSAASKVCQETQVQPIKRPRPNEVGNDLEVYVQTAMTQAGHMVAAPKARNGGGKSTGYPDLLVETGTMPIYLEIKSFAAKNKDTTQRSFYLSPSENPKVTRDAHHLILGFEVARDGNLFRAVAFEIVELFGLPCDMKVEFNSDNKRMYDPSRILLEKRVDGSS